MPEKDVIIHIRVNSKLKEQIESLTSESMKYDSVSGLIREILIDYVSGKLVYQSSNKPIVKQESEIDKTIEMLKELKDLKESQKATEERVMRFIQYVENGLQTFPSEEPKWNIEAEIIRLIEIKPMTSEELAKAFKMTESRILKFLNPMLKTKVIGVNENMEYVFLESKEDLKKYTTKEVD